MEMKKHENLPVYEIPTEILLKGGNHLLKNQYECFAYTVASHRFICAPERIDLDEQLCYDLGYRIYELLYHGGAIVVEEGDICFAYFGRSGNTFKEDILNYVVNWLKEKGINATIDKNDVLVDGCKCLGIGHNKHGVVDFYTGYIGVNPNLENIKKICNKPMAKTPRGLGEYGIDTEQVREMFLAFCKEYDEKQKSKNAKLNIPLNIFNKKKLGV